MTATKLDWSMAPAHALLVRRAAPIASAIYRHENLDIRDVAEGSPSRPRSRTVSLCATDEPNLRRDGQSRVSVGYTCPESAASLAMLLAAMAGPEDPIAADPESLSVFALAERLAASDIPVLINGPTGTGKEVLSRFIHSRSNRSSGPFIAVNCAALPDAMLEAMLFGHQKGAFTGATQASEGFMRAADGGTLLLDEIAELPLALQAKLLRALQEQEVVPIGSTQPIKIDVRIIAAANRNLPLEVAEGRFRADLYYRLNVFPLALKALRERPDDIPPLAFAMALRHTPQGLPVPCLTDEAITMLRAHTWAGNVRELENVMRRALLLAHGEAVIGPAQIVFDPSIHTATPTTTGTHIGEVLQFVPRNGDKLSTIVQDSEARAIISTLEACGGNRGQTARELGISERTLRYRLASMRDAGIELDRRMAGGTR